MLRKVLLACGVLSSLLYAATDVLAAILYSPYHSFTSRFVSELMARGAPTRLPAIATLEVSEAHP